jgi:hypothetical protein
MEILNFRDLWIALNEFVAELMHLDYYEPESDSEPEPENELEFNLI